MVEEEEGKESVEGETGDRRGGVCDGSEGGVVEDGEEAPPEPPSPGDAAAKREPPTPPAAAFRPSSSPTGARP